MDKEVLLTKLRALKKLTESLLENQRRNFFDPKYTLDIFDRFNSINLDLKTKYKELFNDFTIRAIPTPSNTSDFNGRGYIGREHFERLNRDINYCLDILLKKPTVDVSSMVILKEGIFFAGQHYDAFQKISEIIKSDKKSIFIVDNYISDEVLDRLTVKEKNINVSILTSSESLDPQLEIAISSFNKQYCNLEVRISEAFHDRFIFVDETNLYHFGASIKDAGNRGFMFSRIEENEIIKILKRKFEEEWGKNKKFKK